MSFSIEFLPLPQDFLNPRKKTISSFRFSPFLCLDSYIQKSFPQCGACGCFHFHFFPNPYIAFQVSKYFSWIKLQQRNHYFSWNVSMFLISRKYKTTTAEPLSLSRRDTFLSYSPLRTANCASMSSMASVARR